MRQRICKLPPEISRPVSGWPFVWILMRVCTNRSTRYGDPLCHFQYQRNLGLTVASESSRTLYVSFAVQVSDCDCRLSLYAGTWRVKER